MNPEKSKEYKTKKAAGGEYCRRFVETLDIDDPDEKKAALFRLHKFGREHTDEKAYDADLERYVDMKEMWNDADRSLVNERIKEEK